MERTCSQLYIVPMDLESPLDYPTSPTHKEHIIYYFLVGTWISQATYGMESRTSMKNTVVQLPDHDEMY